MHVDTESLEVCCLFLIYKFINQPTKVVQKCWRRRNRIPRVHYYGNLEWFHFKYYKFVCSLPPGTFIKLPYCHFAESNLLDCFSFTFGLFSGAVDQENEKEQASVGGLLLVSSCRSNKDHRLRLWPHGLWFFPLCLVYILWIAGGLLSTEKLTFPCTGGGQKKVAILKNIVNLVWLSQEEKKLRKTMYF